MFASKKLYMITALLVAGLLFGVGCRSNKKIKVYLLAGQSNMGGLGDNSKLPAEYQKAQPNVQIYYTRAPGVDGMWDALKGGFGGRGEIFGPEVTFGHKMAELHKGQQIAIVKYAFGGTGLYGPWHRPEANGEGAGFLYTNFIKYVGNAIESLSLLSEDEIEIAGMAWQQGEKDSRDDGEHKAKAYEENLTNFIIGLRRDLNSPDMPFVLGYVSELEKKKFSTGHNYPYSAVVRKAQYNVSQAVANIKVVQTADLTFKEDEKHYDAAGQMELGFRYAEAMSEMERD